MVVLLAVVCVRGNRLARHEPEGQHVRNHVAVHEPVAGALGGPREVHRAVRPHRLGDGLSPLGHRVDGVARRAPLRVHREEEAVQMHRVRPIGGVDPSPRGALADRHRQALGERPRPSVDRRHPDAHAMDRVGRRGIGRHLDQRDEEHAIVARAPTRRVDDERAVELAVLAGLLGAQGIEAREVEIGAGLPRGKAHRVRGAGRDDDRRAVGRGARDQPPHVERLRERVSQRDPKLGAGAHANQRARVLRRATFLGEHGDAHRWAVVRRFPLRGVGHQRELEHVVVEPPGASLVRVRPRHGGTPLRRLTSRRRRLEQRDGHQRGGQE